MHMMRATPVQKLLAEYSFPLEPLQDFELNGKAAKYAADHPKEWGGEDEIIDFGEELRGIESPYTSYHSAVSSDAKLLAISASNGPVLVYDIATKELRQVLQGSGDLVFRPTQVKAKDAETTQDNGLEGTQSPAYSLMSCIPREDVQIRGRYGLILWDLDQNGRLLDLEEPIDPSAFATQAIDAILPDLSAKHEWSKDFVAASVLHDSFTKALQGVAADHARRHYTVFDNATLGHFGSVPFSPDGKFLLYLLRDPAVEHSDVVVYNLETGTQTYRLSGHTDSIMWTGFSPDSQHIASVSWDGTMRMYTASTGELAWVTPKSRSQCWAAAFSPDSKHIVWSSNGGTTIQVHAVSDGALVSTFASELRHWCRSLAWKPDGTQIALCANTDAYVWRPFDGPTGTIEQRYQIQDPRRRATGYDAEVMGFAWVGDESLLCLQVSDGSKLVYDTKANTKELFKRTDGVVTGFTYFAIHGLFGGAGGERSYLFVDGDGKVRFWRRLALPPSSTDDREEAGATSPEAKEKNEIPEVAAEREPLPERIIPEEDGKDWADSGAALWTAE